MSLIKYALLLLFTAAGFASTAKPKPTTITCKVINNKGGAIRLYRLEDGEAVSLGFRRPGPADTCVFSIQMEKEGVYFLRKASGTMHYFNTVLYLKPGESKTVVVYTNVNGPDFDSCNVVAANTETISLQRWTDTFNRVYKLGSNWNKRDEFFAAYRQLENVAAALKRSGLTANRHFNQLYVSRIKADMMYAKVAAYFYFVRRMNSKYDTSEVNKSFYRSLEELRFCDASLLHSENGLGMLNYVITYKLMQRHNNPAPALAAGIKNRLDEVCNDTLRGVLLTDRISRLTNYNQLVDEIQPLKASLVTAQQKRYYSLKENELRIYGKGSPAYNFKLKNTTGRDISLADFKGKVVVLDVWAMWCGPCLAEKPNFQKLEEAYEHRDDIAFVGISVDGEGKKEAWKQFVAKKGYTSVELLANPDESIMKYYKIVGIPRFMIFDKEGRIVTVDAPRPSSPAFKQLIDQTLSTYN